MTTRTFVTAGAGQKPTDEDFEALRKRTDAAVASVEEMLKPENLTKLVSDALAPVLKDLGIKPQTDAMNAAGGRKPAPGSNPFKLPKAEN